MPRNVTSQSFVSRFVGLLKKGARRILRKPKPPTIPRHPFDEQNGVDTSGLIENSQLRTGHGNDAFNTAYFGVPPSRFLHAIERWQATPSIQPLQEYRMVDVGCGKGRAVLLASAMPFRDVIGIELHPALAATAEANLATWRQKGKVVTDTSIRCADGPSEFPDLLLGPTLVYLYNPFRAPVLHALLSAILAGHHHLKAPVDILYLYPEHENVFKDYPQFNLLWHEDIAISREDENDGLSSSTDPCCLYRLRPKTSVDAL
jgi:SAM-dependent methyltransferase